MNWGKLFDESVQNVRNKEIIEKLNIDKFKLDELESEKLVETMEVQGRFIVDYLINIYKPVLLVAAYSGGNDSIVSTHFLISNYCQYNPEVVYCDTLIGLDKTREHIKKVCEEYGWLLNSEKAMCGGKPKYSWEKINGKNKKVEFKEEKLPLGKWIDGETPYEEFIYNFGFPGPPQHARMFQRLKERPLYIYLNRKRKELKSKKGKIFIISGIRRDESSIRAGYKRCYQQVNNVIWINPFYYTSKYAFNVYREEYGLKRNPVSDLIGFSGECLCGAYAKPNELLLIEKVEKGTFNNIKILEQKVKNSGHSRCFWGNKTGKDIEDGEIFTPMCVGCERRNI